MCERAVGQEHDWQQYLSTVRACSTRTARAPSCPVPGGRPWPSSPGSWRSECSADEAPGSPRGDCVLPGRRTRHARPGPGHVPAHSPERSLYAPAQRRPATPPPACGVQRPLRRRDRPRRLGPAAEGDWRRDNQRFGVLATVGVGAGKLHERLPPRPRHGHQNLTEGARRGFGGAPPACRPATAPRRGRRVRWRGRPTGCASRDLIHRPARSPRPLQQRDSREVVTALRRSCVHRSAARSAARPTPGSAPSPPRRQRPGAG